MDEKVTNLDVGLVAAGVISGRVVDFEREPVPDARVRAYALLHRRKQVILSLVARAQADDLGEYRLYNLAGGNTSSRRPRRASERQGASFTPALRMSTTPMR